jgi:hypothetical protein
MLRLIKEYIFSVFKLWWITLFSVGFAILGVVPCFVSNFVFPPWIGFSLAVVFLFVAHFLVYKKVRQERDELTLAPERVLKKLRETTYYLSEYQTNACEVLKQYTDELAIGLPSDEIITQLEPIFTELCVLKIISSRKYLSKDGLDKTEWVLTDYGKTLIDKLSQSILF